MTREEIEQRFRDMLLVQPQGWNSKYWIIPYNKTDITIEMVMGNIFMIRINKTLPEIKNGWYVPEDGIRVIQEIIQHDLDVADLDWKQRITRRIKGDFKYA